MFRTYYIIQLELNQHYGLIYLLSDNEPYNFIKENSETFKQKLNAKIIIEKEKGHFTEDDGVTELPIVLNKLLDMLK